MSTVRTPQNSVTENEEVNVDKTVRATNFDAVPMTPPKEEKPKPLDGTIRIDMPKANVVAKQAAPSAKPLDGTVRAPGINQPIAPKPAARPLDGTVRAPGINQPIAPKPAAPAPSRTTRGAQPQPQRPSAPRPNVNISIISSVDNEDRAKKLKQQRNEVDENIFVLKGHDYKRVSILSENTGEAEVFLVERDHKEYVLKVYYPNFDVNRKILQTVLNFDFEMVVKVYDFGKTYVDGKHRYYELMEYLRGGSMAEFKLEGDMDKFRRIVLQSAAALAYCHQLRILHRISNLATSSSAIRIITNWCWVISVSRACLRRMVRHIRPPRPVHQSMQRLKCTQMLSMVL